MKIKRNGRKKERKMKKRLLALCLAFVMVLSFTACGGNNQNDSKATDNSGEKESVTIPGGDSDVVDNTDVENTDYVLPELKFDLGQFNVTPMGHRGHGQVTYSVYEMLYTTENGIGTPMVPLLADANRGGNNPMGLKGMDHEAGSTEYTFYIYDYITDSAGNKITASDVVFSFETTKDYGQATGWGDIKGWEAVDDTTIKMTTSRELDRKGELENILLRCCIFSKKAYEDSPSGFTTDACGTGPYVVTDFVQDASVTCELRDDYWQTNKELRPRSAEGNVKKFIGYAITDNNTKITSLKSGDIELIANVPTTQVGEFLNDDKYNVYSYNANGIHYLDLNCSPDSIMSDLNMRLAIYYAISNENLANILNATGVKAYYPLNAPGHDLFEDYVEKWDTEKNYVTEYNLELSKEYAEKAGYNGQEIYLLNANDTSGIVENLQNMLINAGFNVKLKSYDRNTVSSYLTNSKEWDLYYNMTNSSDYMTSLWDHALAVNNGVTESFIDDAKYIELLDKALTVGATEDDLDAFWKYCVENGYFYPLVGGINSMILPKDKVVSVYRNDKNQFVPGAAYYKGE